MKKHLKCYFLKYATLLTYSKTKKPKSSQPKRQQDSPQILPHKINIVLELLDLSKIHLWVSRRPMRTWWDSWTLSLPQTLILRTWTKYFLHQYRSWTTTKTILKELQKSFTPLTKTFMLSLLQNLKIMFQSREKWKIHPNYFPKIRTKSPWLSACLERRRNTGIDLNLMNKYLTLCTGIKNFPWRLGW